MDPPWYGHPFIQYCKHMDVKQEPLQDEFSLQKGHVSLPRLLEDKWVINTWSGLYPMTPQNHQPSCMSQRANHNSVNRSDPPGRQTQPWRIGEELGRCDQQRSGERAIFEPRAWIWATNGRRIEHWVKVGHIGCITGREQGKCFPKNTLAIY